MNSSSQSKSLSVQVKRDVPSTLDRADIVIIGNGIAGLTAAIEARRYSPDKRIVMITNQLHPTINTPALKQYAVNKLQSEQLLAYPPGTERSERIHVINAHVEEIHAQSKYLGLDKNRAFGYDTLLVATGSKAMGLPEETPGRSFDGVKVLHRLEDYLDLRRRLPEVREAVVIGGGVHANETVMGLLHWGIRVHWLIRGKTFLSRMFDSTASEMILNSVRRAGAVIHTETEVTAIIGRVGSVAGVITNTREMLPCQLVLCCTGTGPAQELAKRCTVPMKFNNGILVDDQLRTSVRDIYAAGDVAALPNPQTGKYETRALWYAAVLQGKIAGAMMTGHGEVAKNPFGTPWHSTHLGEYSVLSVGNPLSTDKQIAIYTDTSGGGYRRLAAIDDLMVGYLSVDTAPLDSLSIKRFVDEGISIRDVVKPLLKGKLDVRGYLASAQVRSARKMLSNKIPSLQEIQVPQVPAPDPYQIQRPSGQPALPMPSIPAARQMDEMQFEKQGQRVGGEVGTAKAYPYAKPEQNRENDVMPFVAQESKRATDNTRRQMFFEEEISPFSGNLPAVNLGNPSMYNDQRDREALQTRQASTNQRSTTAEPSRRDRDAFLVEEVSPFSGNLPAFNVVESSISQTSRTNGTNAPRKSATPPVPVPSKGATRNLWQYATGDLPRSV